MERCGDVELCIRNRRERITASTAECSVLSIHFPFDSAALEAVDRNDRNDAVEQRFG